MDWMAQEQERGITITSAATTCFLAGHGTSSFLSTVSTLSIPQGTLTSPLKLSVPYAYSMVLSLCCVVLPAFSRRLKLYGARRQVSKCRVWFSSTRWTVPALTSSCVVDQIENRLGANLCLFKSTGARKKTSKALVDLIQMKAINWDEEEPGYDIMTSKIFRLSCKKPQKLRENWSKLLPKL